jgi:hypothetical protein
MVNLGGDTEGVCDTCHGTGVETPTPPARGAFTALELFPPANGVTTSDCAECGAYVRIPKQNLHAGWHNKVADL